MSPTPRRRPALGSMAAVVITAGLALAMVQCAPRIPEDGLPPRAPRPTATTPAPDVDAAAPDAGSSAVRNGAVADVPVRSAGLDDAAAAAAAVPPTAIAIPAIDVEVPVDPVGVQPDGQMEIPPLAERAGWYRFGAAPGDEAGTTVVAAHVDSVASAGLGPFARLVDLAVGDEITVTSADGGARRYVVTLVGSQPKSDVAWDDVFTRDGAPRLVLITCGGTFRREVSSYSDNVLVVAEQAP